MMTRRHLRPCRPRAVRRRATAARRARAGARRDEDRHDDVRVGNLQRGREHTVLLARKTRLVGSTSSANRATTAAPTASASLHARPLCDDRGQTKCWLCRMPRPRPASPTNQKEHRELVAPHQRVLQNVAREDAARENSDLDDQECDRRRFAQHPMVFDPRYPAMPIRPDGDLRSPS